MTRFALLSALLVTLVVGCTDEATTSRGPVEQTEADESSEGSSDDAVAAADCESANDRALCLVQALDGPTEEEPLLALINAHEELGNHERARALRTRYVALFDDATADLFARDLPTTPTDESAEPRDEPRAQAEGDGPSEPPEEEQPAEQSTTATPAMAMQNPLMACAALPNYNACILRNLREPSSPREYEALINAFKETGQRARACEMMAEVIQNHPTSPAARRFMQFHERNCN